MKSCCTGGNNHFLISFAELHAMPTRGSHLPQKPKTGCAGGPRLPPTSDARMTTPRHSAAAENRRNHGPGKRISLRPPAGARGTRSPCRGSMPRAPGPLHGITADKQTPHRAHPEGRGGPAAVGGVCPRRGPIPGSRSALRVSREMEPF